MVVQQHILHNDTLGAHALYGVVYASPLSVTSRKSITLAVILVQLSGFE